MLPTQTVQELAVQLDLQDAQLHGDLRLPATPRGIILFAHGSGSSRRSPRNRFVARALGEAGLATFLFDLLTEREEATDAYTAEFRFDLPRLTRRLLGATRWIRAQKLTAALSVGYFGASTGAAAALRAAAEEPEGIFAVVSRGGRPDLAGPALSKVLAPTLLIVGGYDTEVITLNQQALEQLPGEKALTIVPRATHLFEEPGALEQVATLAADWFGRHAPGER
ncbi:MAG TPA: hypothetical protein VGM19_02795 [Armatimonadota bacterium]|jgi:dienelactone hydrolase